MQTTLGDVPIHGNVFHVEEILQNIVTGHVNPHSLVELNELEQKFIHRLRSGCLHKKGDSKAHGLHSGQKYESKSLEVRNPHDRESLEGRLYRS